MKNTESPKGYSKYLSRKENVTRVRTCTTCRSRYLRKVYDFRPFLGQRSTKS